MEIYDYSFPYEEKRSMDNMALSLKDGRFHFLALYADEEKAKESVPTGMLTFWDMGEYLYGEHFAIDRAARNGGIGSRILDILKSFGKPIILEIEIPDNETAARRQKFYERNGFILNGHKHFQPPYHSDCRFLEMKIMTWPETITAAEYEKFRKEQLTIMPSDK